MTAARLTFGLLLATVAIAATACGGGSESVPSGAVAVVDGTQISKREVDEFVTRAKKGYEAQKQEFPKAGTPEYQNFQQRYLAGLVQIEEWRHAAKELDIEVTAKDIDAVESRFIKSEYKGDRAAYEKALKKQFWTPEQYRRLWFGVSVLRTKIFQAVTKDVGVTDQELLTYYTENQSQFGSPDSRDVRHILIAEKDKDGNIDFEASKAKADKIYEELTNGASFAKLAKAESQDPGSKDGGGRYTVERGQTVPEFEKVAFELDKGELAKPVKNAQYGYFVIQAISDVRKGKSFDDVKAVVRAQLLQQKRNEAAQAWSEDVTKDYEGKVRYAAGYELPQPPEEPTDTQ